MADEIQATQRQRNAVNNVVGNGGNITEAMRQAGYSENTYNTPQKLTESKAYKLLLNKYLSDDSLLLKHKQLLNKQETIVRNNVSTGEIDIIPTGQPETQAVSKALDMAYKLKGMYANEGATAIQINVGDIRHKYSKRSTE